MKYSAFLCAVPVIFAGTFAHATTVAFDSTFLMDDRGVIEIAFEGEDTNGDGIINRVAGATPELSSLDVRATAFDGETVFFGMGFAEFDSAASFDLADTLFFNYGINGSSFSFGLERGSEFFSFEQARDGSITATLIALSVSGSGNPVNNGIDGVPVVTSALADVSQVPLPLSGGLLLSALLLLPLRNLRSKGGLPRTL